MMIRNIFRIRISSKRVFHFHRSIDLVERWSPMVDGRLMSSLSTSSPEDQTPTTTSTTTKEEEEPSAKRKWTPEEDLLLKKGVEELGKQWSAISKQYLPHRNRKSLAARWDSFQLDLKTGAWEPEEDAKLIALVQTHGESSWQKIANEMDGRSFNSCYYRWYRQLAPAVLDPSLEWKIEEDDKLKELILEDNTNHLIRSDWTSVIASQLPQCTNEQCRLRYRHLREKGWKLAPRETSWTEKEDDELIKVVKESLLSSSSLEDTSSIEWTAIANTMSTHRTARECQRRWQKKLIPRLNGNPWTKEEDDIILTKRRQAIPCREIRRHLKGRTLDAIYQRCKDLGVEPKPGRAWSKEEIELLVNLVKEYKASGKRVNWTNIAKQMSSERTAVTCSQAWLRATTPTASQQPEHSDDDRDMKTISAVASSSDNSIEEDRVVVITNKDVCSSQLEEEQHGSTTTNDSKDQLVQNDQVVIKAEEAVVISLGHGQDKIESNPVDCTVVIPQEEAVTLAAHDDKKDIMTTTTSTESSPPVTPAANVANATAMVNEKNSVDKEDSSGIIKFLRKLLSW
eukprot:scaffold3414_cov183-Ochromonas_danica.AAC.10